MIPSVDHYLELGCGRCSHYKKPSCKVHQWTRELSFLRSLVRSTELVEEVKWSQPCYTLHGKNVLMIAAFRGYCCISFMKGILLNDPDHLLELPGENSHAGRVVKLTGDERSIALINNPAPLLDLILQAIHHEHVGTLIPEKIDRSVTIPEDLQREFDANPGLEEAFFALTPGRQRAYHLLISSAAKSETKVRRIRKFIPVILSGKGPHD